MRKWEIFTDDDKELGGSPGGCYISISSANRILNERASGKGYNKPREGYDGFTPITGYVTKERQDCDTQEALVFLREIEEEVEECECYGNSHRLHFDKHDIISVEYVDNNFCPKCGKDLRE